MYVRLPITPICALCYNTISPTLLGRLTLVFSVEMCAFVATRTLTKSGTLTAMLATVEQMCFSPF